MIGLVAVGVYLTIGFLIAKVMMNNIKNDIKWYERQLEWRMEQKSLDFTTFEEKIEIVKEIRELDEKYKSELKIKELYDTYNEALVDRIILPTLTIIMPAISAWVALEGIIKWINKK